MPTGADRGRRVRIGIDITSLRIAKGGIYWYDLSLLRALLEVDRRNEYHLVDYTSARSDRELPREIAGLERPGVQVVPCRGLPLRRVSNWNAARWPVLQTITALIDRTILAPWAAAAQASMRRELDRTLGHLDVFHSSAVVQWRPPGGVSVITLYDLATRVLPDDHSPVERALQRTKHRFACRQADVVVAISESTKRDTVTYLGIDPGRISVVPGAVGPEFHPIDDPEALQTALAPQGLSPGGYLLHVGTLEARKNLPLLVEAYSQARRFVRGVTPLLVLAGAHGWRGDETRKRAEELGVEEHVRFLGRVPRQLLPALYNGAIAVAYPSLYEGFGLPPLEAMACGTPVVASDTPAVREVVGEAGELVDSSDVGELARAIRSVLLDSDRRARLREAGLLRAKQFTWEASARRLLNVYSGEN